MTFSPEVCFWKSNISNWLDELKVMIEAILRVFKTSMLPCTNGHVIMSHNIDYLLAIFWTAKGRENLGENHISDFALTNMAVEKS